MSEESDCPAKRGSGWVICLANQGTAKEISGLHCTKELRECCQEALKMGEEKGKRRNPISGRFEPKDLTPDNLKSNDYFMHRKARPTGTTDLRGNWVPERNSGSSHNRITEDLVSGEED